jgi:protein TonB
VPGGILGDDRPRRIDSTITPPFVISRVTPVYPELARRARLEGKVFLEAVVTKDGAVQEIRELRSSNRMFTEAAIAAVSQWRYQPALMDGRPVAVYITIVVSFDLE